MCINFSIDWRLQHVLVCCPLKLSCVAYLSTKPVFHLVMEGDAATSGKEASAEEWAEDEEEECMAMVVVVASMATTTMDLTMEEVDLEDEVVMMIGARGLERIWMDLPAG